MDAYRRVVASGQNIADKRPCWAAITKRYFDLGWMERMRRSHAVIVTPVGRQGFRETFGIDASEPGDRRKPQPHR